MCNCNSMLIVHDHCVSLVPSRLYDNITYEMMYLICLNHFDKTLKGYCEFIFCKMSSNGLFQVVVGHSILTIQSKICTIPQY